MSLQIHHESVPGGVIDCECLTTPVTDSIKIITSYWVLGVNDEKNVLGLITVEVIWSLTP